MKILVEHRDGEASLEFKIFESEHLHNIIQEVLRRNLTFDDLRTDRVTKDGCWISTAESTVSAPVLYLTNPKNNDSYLITKRPKDNKYALFTYRWTP